MGVNYHLLTGMILQVVEIVDGDSVMYLLWSNYSDLTQPKNPKGSWGREMGTLISGTSGLVKYSNLARSYLGFV